MTPNPQGPPPASRDARDAWDSHWDRLAEQAEFNPAQKMRHEWAVSQAVRLGDGNVLLDIGSGQGDLLFLMAATGVAARLIGFEVSATGVEITRRKVPTADVYQVDMYDPPSDVRFLEQSSDIVVCLEVIEHVDDPIALLTSVRRFMKPGATLLLSTPAGPLYALARHIGHRRHFTRREVHETLERAGFAVAKVSLAGFPFFNLYRLLLMALGRRLVKDAPSDYGKRPYRIATATFELLFRWTMADSPFGWQVFAVAHNPPDGPTGN